MTGFAGVEIWAALTGISVFSALAVTTYALGDVEPGPVRSFTEWAPWVLGPKSEALRANALADIRLALEHLDQPSSANRLTDIREYGAGLDHAERTLRLATQASAADSRSLQALALVQFETHLLGPSTKPDGHRPLLELARQRRPGDVRFQLDVAATYLRIGDPDTALAIAGDVVRANAHVAPQAVAIFGDYDVDPGTVAGSLGDSPGVLLALKTSFVERGLLSDYMSALERVIPSASPEIIDEYGNLGEQLHEWTRVRETLERLGPLGDKNAEALRVAVLARSRFAEGELVEAEVYARRAVSVEPANAQLHELLADCLGALGRNEEALASLDVALIAAVSGITSDGQRGRLYRKMGEAHERQGRGDRAYEDYRRAVELVPEDAIASQRLRSIAGGQGRVPSGS